MRKIVILLVLFNSLHGAAQTLQPLTEHTLEGKVEMTNFIVKDTLLIWPQGEEGLKIYTISNPDSLKLLSTFKEYATRSRRDIYGTAYHTLMRNDTVFLCYGELGLKILDISEPRIPVELGTYYRNHSVYTLDLYKNYAFLGLKDLGLEIVDFSSMNNIEMAGRNNLKDFPSQHVVVMPPYTLVSGGKRGIKIFKFRSPFTEFKWAHYPKDYHPENDANKLVVSGKHGYLANDFKGLTVLNLTLPSYPMQQTTIKTDGRAEDILLNNTTLYVASGKSIYLYDISDKATPTLISQYESKKKRFQALYLANGQLWALYDRGFRSFGIMLFDILQ